VDVKLEVIEIPVAHADRAPNAGNGQGRLPANAKYGLVAVASVAAIGMFLSVLDSSASASASA
jgi:hypothetical protein